MLKEICVSNLAIIEDITLDFKEGFTVLTGQTGAGKSLIIDSIGLILGDRADNDLIRYGEKEALIKATLTDLNQNVWDYLDSIGISHADTLTIERRININNRNSIKVNDKQVSLQELKRLGMFLGDIHVQFDTYRLINKDNYLSFLDDYNDPKFVKLMNAYQIALNNYLTAYDKLKESEKKNRDLSNRLEYLEYEKNELEELDLEEDIDIKLESEINKLANYDKIYQNLNESYYLLTGDNFSNDILYEAKNKMDKLALFDVRYQEIAKLLNDAYYQVDEAESALYKLKDELDFDPDYLDQLNNRLYKINKAKEKYHKGVNELIFYLKEITLDIDLATNFDEAIKNLTKELKNQHDILLQKAIDLRNYRQKEAKIIETKIVKECFDLDLENTIFNINFNSFDEKDYLDKAKFNERGIDEIDFLISFNKGEPVKPLSKVASGGELSRLMLAFKIIYLSKNDLSFMVFDEIDSGVSGITARKIGRKLKEISKDVQILAITHLAQVASLADTHMHISKEVTNNRTKTNVKELKGQERIEEIALMLSGIGISSEMLSSAKKMIADD